MTLSRQSVEILLDLIEIKVSNLHIQDREDARELNKLRKCRQELLSNDGESSLKQIEENLKSRSPQTFRARRAYYSK
ncbi:MAG: hypothetical protein JNJ47_00595 [Alphaproteobacteria bacterium]|nr:hypothetical protein [Alphaproteobacteria bacterium]